jgi:hypothetical protein
VQGVPQDFFGDAFSHVMGKPPSPPPDSDDGSDDCSPDAGEQGVAEIWMQKEGREGERGAGPRQGRMRRDRSVPQRHMDGMERKNVK